ncbi:N-acetylmuramoyl-L-alanine amidase [Pseudomonas savastanoi]|nr:N-acetylmuramoyl-L-alanine amidase [Pseudomonas savastanoi]
MLLNMLLASAALTLPLGAYATQIRNARLWRTNDKLRLVLDLSGRCSTKLSRLPPPTV